MIPLTRVRTGGGASSEWCLDSRWTLCGCFLCPLHMWSVGSSNAGRLHSLYLSSVERGRQKEERIRCYAMRSFTSQQSTDLQRTKNPSKFVYRSLKKGNKKKGGLWSGAVWMTNLKWRLQNVMDTVTGSGQESFVGVTDAILSCTGCHHLCTTVQPILCCRQLCSRPCSCPRNYFLFVFLVPSCGKFLNSCSKSATQNWNPPSCGDGGGREQHSTASASHVRAPPVTFT